MRLGLRLGLSDSIGTPVFGSELIPNGRFDVDASGWATGYSSSLSVVSGALRITSAGTVSHALIGTTALGSGINIVNNRLYCFSSYFVGRSDSGNADWRAGTTNEGQEYFRANPITPLSTTVRYFVGRTASQFHVGLFMPASSNGVTADWDNISLRMVNRGTIGTNLAANTYTMTGGTETPTGTLNLNGTGQFGDKSMTTVANQPYRIRWTGGANVSTVAVGTAQGGTQLLTSQTGVVGANEFFIVASGTTSWVRFAGTAAGAGTVSAIEIASITP
jgi:hypothetical protein